MRAKASSNGILVILIAATLIAPVALAYHNSVGVHVQIVTPDEIGTGGTLLPDVGPALLPIYHTNLATPRTGPPDQTGLQYRNGACDATSTCYVGFIDGQWEYITVFTNYGWNRPNDRYPCCHGLGTTVAGVPVSANVVQIPSYSINPAPGDPNCPTTTPQDRIENLQDPNCQGSGHPLYYIGQANVDVNLLDAPFDQSQAVLGNDVGSGSQVWPLLITPYVYLFGQPHPSNPEASDLKAGLPPFADVPADACKGRTADGPDADLAPDCYLLTPADIRLYDTRAPAASASDPRPRVCDYKPQFTTINPSARNAGLCGFAGSLANVFTMDETAGGFAIAGAPATWVNLKPGWYEGTTLLTHLTLGDGDGPGTGLQQYWVVNPKVPEQTDALWCVAPNFYTDGDLVHGTYQADAIDTDLFRSPFAAQEEAAFDLTDPVVDDTVESVNTILDAVFAAVNGVLDSLPPLPPEVEDALAEADALSGEAADRADPLEAAIVEPDQPGDASGTAASPDFAVVRPALPLSCNAAGALVTSDAVTLPGILRFNANIVMTAIAATEGDSLKDPTVLESGLPAREQDTTRGYWWTAPYTFGGAAVAVYDSNEDSDFDACATESGQAQPANDLCPWKALWDAYNPFATTFTGEKVGDLLNGRGYDVGRGVGMSFVLKVTGPVIIANEEVQDTSTGVTGGTRTQALGLGNPIGTNCIVGTSLGFSLTPAFLQGAANADLRVAQLCAGTDGDQVLVEDAFNNGIGDGAGTYSAAIEWVKALTTPSATAATLGSDGDSLCVTGAWSVKASTIASDTLGSPTVTGDNLELSGGASGATHYFTDCDMFTSELRSA